MVSDLVLLTFLAAIPISAFFGFYVAWRYV